MSKSAKPDEKSSYLIVRDREEPEAPQSIRVHHRLTWPSDPTLEIAEELL
jgi:hypothetical protein